MKKNEIFKIGIEQNRKTGGKFRQMRELEDNKHLNNLNQQTHTYGVADCFAIWTKLEGEIYVNSSRSFNYNHNCAGESKQPINTHEEESQKKRT